ncbi:MAG: LamG domain-containing protein, partial [Candidatus Bathyarchaeia archaeon]
IISERRNYQGAYLQVSSDGKYIEFYVNNVEVSSKRITLNTWYYVVGTFDGLTARLYLNGQLHSSLPASLTWPSDSMYVGDAYSHIVKFYGFIDEVRVSSIARSQSWILTEYNNQLNPSTFYTIGPEEQYAYNNSAVGEYFDSFNNNILQTGNTNKLESQQETNLAYLTPITWLAAIPIGLKPRQSHARNKNRNKCRLVLQQATLGIELYGTAAHTSAYHKPQAKSITPYN